MARATLTSKGQITLPREVREALGLRPGDRVDFRVREDGTVTVEPEAVSFLSLFGMLNPRVRGVTVEGMDEAIRKAAARR